MRNYIPVKKLWLKMFTTFDKPYFTSELKVPIEKIKIDKALFAYQNEISQSDVLYMLVNFDREVWMPIRLNKDYYLLNGQHRLEVARQLGLSFIDVIIEDTELLTEKADNGKSGRYHKIKET